MNTTSGRFEGRPAIKRYGRKAAVAAVLVSGMTALSACGGGSSSAGGSSKEILIGVPAAMTGVGAAYGLPQSHAAQMVADAINASGGIKELGGAKIKLIIKDTQSNPVTTGKVLRELKAQKVSAIIGPVLSGEVTANKPLIQSLKIPAFLGSGTPVITQGNVDGYVFRTSSNVVVSTEQTADYIKNLISTGQVKDVKKVGVLAVSLAPGDSFLAAMKQGLAAQGLTPTIITYDPTQVKDFAPFVAKLKQANVDIVTGFQYPGDATLFAQAVARQDWRPRAGFFFTGSPQYQDAFRKALGAKVAGWVTSSFCSSIQTDAFPTQVHTIGTEFQQKYGQSLEGTSACVGGTNMALIADAIATAKSSDPQKITDAARTMTFADPKSSPYPYYMTPGGVKFDQNQDNTLLTIPFAQVTPSGGFNTVFPAAVANAKLVLQNNS